VGRLLEARFPGKGLIRKALLEEFLNPIIIGIGLGISFLIGRNGRF